VLDLPVQGADPVIGERAYATDAARVVRLGRAVCEGLLASGVLPVVKHIPGHGRARVDSHHACPIVETARDELNRTDFAPFRALSGMPWAMTAHIVYMSIDARAPATLSPSVIFEAIRSDIGFNGILVSDDLSMQALGGELGERARSALAAGCDLVLHCNGDLRQMQAVVEAAGSISAETAARLAQGEALRRSCASDGFDRHATEAQFDALLAGARLAPAER
jgi:beta-N-acetylhexosaminidase